MERPEKVYLAEPIEINGIKVQHTEAGLLYMKDLYTTVLSLPLTDQQLKDEHRQYIAKLIENYTIHLQLYEHVRGKETEPMLKHSPSDQANDSREEEIPIGMAEVLHRGDGTDCR